LRQGLSSPLWQLPRRGILLFVFSRFLFFPLILHARLLHDGSPRSAHKAVGHSLLGSSPTKINSDSRGEVKLALGQFHFRSCSNRWIHLQLAVTRQFGLAFHIVPRSQCT